MSERDERLKDLRPKVSTEQQHEKSGYNFEEETVLPIIKFQDSIIVAQFRAYIKKFKPVFTAYNQKVQKSYIADVLHSDPRIKNSLIASVVSILTLEEYDYYCQNKTRSNKSILQLLQQHLSNNTERLY